MNSADFASIDERRPVLPPMALLLSILAQAPLIVLRWPVAPSGLDVAAGAVLVLFGVAINVWAERLFRQGGVGICPFSPAPRLVSGGPFRVTRNPMYLGFVFLCAGVALLSGVVANLWASAALLGWLHFRFVLPEEAFLREHLGSVYENYRSDHSRWLGFPTSR